MLKLTNSLLVGLACVFACLPAAGAAQSGELWEITSKMEMDGMPIAMPSTTSKACVPKDKKEDSLIPKNEGSDCRMTEHKQTGNKTSFKMVCSGKDPMTGSGEITHSGTTYNGRMHLTGKVDGEAMDMKQTFSGKRLGSCEYTPPKDTSKEQIAEACRKASDNLDYPLFTMEGALCQPKKAEFCGRVKKLVGDMGDPDGYTAVAKQHPGWKEAAGACGQETSSVIGKACKGAVDKKHWRFIGEHCDAEVQAMGPQLCEGRGYTTVMSGETGDLCRKYFENNGDPVAGNASGSTAKTLQGTATEVASNPGEAVQKGVKALKGLLNF